MKDFKFTVTQQVTQTAEVIGQADNVDDAQEAVLATIVGLSKKVYCPGVTWDLVIHSTNIGAALEENPSDEDEYCHGAENLAAICGEDGDQIGTFVHCQVCGRPYGRPSKFQGQAYNPPSGPVQRMKDSA